MSIFWYLVSIAGCSSFEELKLRFQDLKSTDALTFNHGKILPKTLFQSSRVASIDDLVISNQSKVMSKIFSWNSLTVGSHCIVNETHALKTLTIGSGSKVGWWASGSEVVLENQLKLPGKIQAKEIIRIGNGVEFNLISSPKITNSQPYEPNLKPNLNVNLIDAPKVFHEDVVLSENEEFPNACVIHRNLIMKAGSTILGSVKVHGNVIMEPGSSIHGNLVCLKNVEMGKKTAITGCVLVSKKLHLLDKVSLGKKEIQQTFTAQEILIEGSFLVQGTLKAWKRGIVI